MMKKEYTTPLMTINQLSSTDIIAVSGLTDGTKQITFKKFNGEAFKEVNF